MIKDIVILLPGIMGSVLADAQGNEIWSLSGGALWKAVTSFGESITGLELPPSGDPEGISAPRLMPDVSIIPGFFKFDGYTRIENELITRLDLDRGHNYFPFPYDWRLDNRVNAKILETFAMDKLLKWRRDSGASDAKLILIGHSMGGLVSRYFLDVLGGWRDTRYLFTLGTPHRGSLNALDFLVHGMKKGIGPLGIDLSPMLRSFPSVYQLLPTYKCIDAGIGDLRRISDTINRLPNLDGARVLRAMEFHRDIESNQKENAALDGYPEKGYRQIPFVGIEQSTQQSATVRGTEVEFLKSCGGKDLGGDGTVPRVSATPVDLEGSDREIYSGEMHGSLQNAEGSLANIHGILTRGDIDWSKYRKKRLTGIRLEIDDVVLPRDPVTIRASLGGDGGVVTVRMMRTDDGLEQIERLSRGADDGWQEGKFDLTPGIWYVRAEAKNHEPVTDIVVVASV
ncbi:MAG: hypothetical protein WCT14_11050 [Treponemataceae bacterium]